MKCSYVSTHRQEGEQTKSLLHASISSIATIVSWTRLLFLDASRHKNYGGRFGVASSFPMMSPVSSLRIHDRNESLRSRSRWICAKTCTYSGEIFVATEIHSLSTMSRTMGHTDRISSSSSSSISSGSIVGSAFDTSGVMYIDQQV